MSILKVLHVLGRLDVGGVERWVTGLSKYCPRHGVEIDVLQTKTGEGILRREFQGRVVSIPLHRNDIMNFCVRLRRVVRDGGYDIVHSHLHRFSAAVAIMMFGMRTPIIAQAHSSGSRTRKVSDAVYSALSNIGFNVARVWPTYVSNAARDAVFHRPRMNGGAWVPCAIDIDTYKKSSISRELTRSHLCLSLGMIGRLVESKNHAFALTVLDALRGAGVNARMVIVGDGPMRDRIERMMKERGLLAHVDLVGLQRNVMKWLTQDIDVFLMTSKYEGLPVSHLEAQLAGIPSVLSDAVTRESALPGFFNRYVPLGGDISLWVEAILEAANVPKVSREVSINVFERSPFSLAKSAERICAIYKIAALAEKDAARRRNYG